MWRPADYDVRAKLAVEVSDEGRGPLLQGLRDRLHGCTVELSRERVGRELLVRARVAATTRGQAVELIERKVEEAVNQLDLDPNDCSWQEICVVP